MVELAHQAFCTNNFGLAAEIYERTIKENGPQTDLLLCLADSYARWGQLTKAFHTYSKALRLGTVTADKLQHLVTGLVENQIQDSCVSGDNQLRTMMESCMFTCVLCCRLLNQPVTIKCGHTFCRKCLERDQTKTCNGLTCRVCGIVHYRLKLSSIRTNVLLSNLIKKWLPNRCRAAELKAEGNSYFERREFQRAVKCYSEAITLYDADHLLFSNRSHAYASLHQYEEALKDAEKVVRMKRDWPKGFFRKGSALFELGQYQDAAIAFLQCLALDKNVALAKDYLSKSLHMVLSMPPQVDHTTLEKPWEGKPCPFQVLLNSNFSLAACQFHLTANPGANTKHITDSAVTEASNFQTSCQTDVCNEEAACSKTNDCDMECESNGPFANIMEKQRCNSVPTMEEHPASSWNRCQCQRSRSQSPQRRRDISDSRKGCPHSSTTVSQHPSHHSSEQSPKTETHKVAGDEVEIDRSMLSVGDMDCSLCFRLLYQPVTTPCGHTFCRACLERSLDHRTACPMCKSCLAEYLAERRSAVTEALQIIISTYFYKEFLERQCMHEEEINELAEMGLDNQHEIPVFVCTLGFPKVLCPLHIFEPRYRLMIRQCMESGTRQFGMCACLSDSEENFSDYGCMLEVRDVRFFADGRSLVDTVGGRRFHVLSRGRRDGYNTARVEFLEDKAFDQSELPEIQSLQNEIYKNTEKWLDSLSPFHQARIFQHFGNIPEMDPNPGANPNGPAWAWWCTAVLPLDPSCQLALLAMCSYKERLELLKIILNHLIHSQQ